MITQKIAKPLAALARTNSRKSALLFNRTYLSLRQQQATCTIASQRFSNVSQRFFTAAATSQPFERSSIDDTVQNDRSATPTSTSSITLRPYQLTAIRECLQALSSGLRRIGVSSPTGSGKTTMFMNLIPLVPFYNNTAIPTGSSGSTLIVVGSVELANQAEGAAKRLLGDEWTVEVEQSKRKASGRADVTIATWQTLINSDRLAKFDPATYKLIIVDEAHHAAALSYLRLLHYFNDEVQLPSTLQPITTLKHEHKVPIIGFSATFSRPDQLALSAVFEKIVFHREITHMLDEGWLAPARSTTVKADLELVEVEINENGDFKPSSLASKVNTKEVNELIVRTYLHRAANRRSTLVFCVDLDHVANLTQAFREAGIDARSISSMSKPEARRDTIASFGAGEFPVLINCEVLTEGTDIPEIDCILLARPTKSRNLLAQMVGRGLRLSPETGKEDCHIIDVVDSVAGANGMLVSPTLLGLTHEERDEELREIAERNMVDDETAAAGKTRQPTTNSDDYNITYIDEDDPFRIASSTRPIVDKASKNAWVVCGKTKYILELIGNGYISIDPGIIGAWAITFRPSIPSGILTNTKSPFGRVRVVGHADDLERALQTADKYAERTLGRELSLRLSRYASWRRKPASEKAIALLLKMQGATTAAASVDNEGREQQVRLFGKSVPVGQLTAGEVSSWLCAARHGAKAVRASLDKADERKRIKAEQKAEKERLQRARNLPLPNSH
ncbi:hypothetical protein CI109_101162 [Kwoniella shandongensis]|uniref:Uncharacterized protein n=1 Tax=Kwoniella shandongensis TaxID=1734106 RepID=A0A5M6C553_9TREE|nr:uncharacterized protein CI109_001631 [Kwoniella shandongensis]KAA5530224.1 hypothetical protein CI109_001631 [Kwoniella shandongensis]